jgi:hypothetical protein
LSVETIRLLARGALLVDLLFFPGRSVYLQYDVPAAAPPRAAPTSTLRRRDFTMIAPLLLSTLFLAASALTAQPESAAGASSVDCSEAYGKAASCQVVRCDPPYDVFLGQWSGPFEEYVREQSTPDKPVFRPYENSMSYRASDCLLNADSGVRFIVGHRSDHYPAFGALPAKTMTGLLITGRRADGSAFLRTVDRSGVSEYTLESKDAATETTIWHLEVPPSQHPCPSATDPSKVCSSPELSFRITDGRDGAAKPANVRHVTIEMTVGPAAAPYWHGVIAKGHHQRHGEGQVQDPRHES